MAHKGLNRDVIVDEGCRLVEEKGIEAFSMRELAARLNVRPAALYNHVENQNALLQEMALRTAEQLRTLLAESMEGKSPDEAFLAGARAYRRFAAEHPYGYQTLIRMPGSDDESLIRASFASFAPLRELIRSYGAGEPATLHFLRCFRAAIHGFAELTANGFMMRGPATRDETYELMIRAYLDQLKGLCTHEEI